MGKIRSVSKLEGLPCSTEGLERRLPGFRPHDGADGRRGKGAALRFRGPCAPVRGAGQRQLRLLAGGRQPEGLVALRHRCHRSPGKLPGNGGLRPAPGAHSGDERRYPYLRRCVHRRHGLHPPGLPAAARSRPGSLPRPGGRGKPRLRGERDLPDEKRPQPGGQRHPEAGEPAHGAV